METNALEEQPEPGELVGHCGHLGPGKPSQKVNATRFDEPTTLSGANISVTLLWALECEACHMENDGERPVVRGFMLWPADGPVVHESVSN